MKWISEEDLKKHIIRDNCDEGCGYIDERDIIDMEWVEDDKFIPLSVLDKIRAEIKQAADKQFQIAMGVSDLNERYAHIQMENAYRHSLSVIDEYKEGSEE